MIQSPFTARHIPHAVLTILLLIPGITGNGKDNPKIHDFEPGEAEPGQILTITGENFDEIPENNSVRFGAVKGTVVSGSSTQIEVEVPAGATHAPLGLRVLDGRVTFSAKAFIPRFSPTGPVTNHSFGQLMPSHPSLPQPAHPPGIALPTGFSGSHKGLVVADFDNNGIPDIAVANRNSGTVIVFRNNSTGADLSAETFAVETTLALQSGLENLAGADLNGNGLTDLVAMNSTRHTISVLENISTAGNIAFSAPVTFEVPWLFPRNLALVDMDGDGWIDLVVQSGTTLAVFRNTGTGGGIASGSFATPVPIIGVDGPFAIKDLNGNGKPDVVTAEWSNPPVVRIYENASTPGNLAAGDFSLAAQLPSLNGARGVAVADLNRNSRSDIVIGTSSGVVGIFPNEGDSHDIHAESFGERIDLSVSATNPWILNITVADVNGDGLPDILTAERSSVVSVAANNGAENLDQAFSPFVQLRIPAGDAATGMEGRVTVADLNLDGRPDLVTDGGNQTIFISQNFVGPLEVDDFEITPSSFGVWIPWNNTRILEARLILSDGSTQNQTQSAVWTSENPSIATVNDQGRVTGVSAGQTVITASHNGYLAEATVIVWPMDFGWDPGNPDQRFLPEISNDGSSGVVESMISLPDGTIIAGGEFSRVNGVPVSNLVRLRENGEVDEGFDPGSGPNGTVTAMAVDGENRLLIAGTFTEVDGNPRHLVARLLPDGQVDSTFTPQILGSAIHALAVNPDGSLFIGGNNLRPESDNQGKPVMKLTQAGSQAPGFSSAIASGVAWTLAPRDDGTLIVGGASLDAGSGTFAMGSLLPNGNLDPEFMIGIESSVVYGLVLPSGNRVVATGDFTSVFGQPVRNLARFNSDGSLDESFVSPFQPAWGTPRALGLGDNDQLYVPGQLSRLIRVLENGEVDPHFNMEPHPGWGIRAITAGTGPFVLVGGGRSSRNGASLMGMIRLHDNVDSFESWQQRFFSSIEINSAPELTGPEGDYLGSGVANLLAYALGLNPMDPSRDNDRLPRKTLVEEGGKVYLAITHAGRISNQDLIYQLGVSEDLMEWDFSGERLEKTGSLLTAEGGELEWISHRLSEPVEEWKSVFLRLRVMGLD